jgi:uncharacterized membrane protein
VTIVAPILTFLQLVLAGIGKWVGGLHVLNAILILGMYGWLTYMLRRGQPAPAEAAPAATAAEGDSGDSRGSGSGRPKLGPARE